MREFRAIILLMYLCVGIDACATTGAHEDAYRIMVKILDGLSQAWPVIEQRLPRPWLDGGYRGDQ